MSCSGSIGWRGYAKVSGNTLPFTRAQVQTKREIIISDPLMVDSKGSNFRFDHNYTLGKELTEANISTEVYSSGGYKAAFLALLNLAIGTSKGCNRLTGGGSSSLEISPNGGTLITLPGSSGKALVTGFSIRGNAGGIIDANFNVVSTSNSTGAASSTADLQFETAGTTEDSNPVPYYATSVVVGGSGQDSIVNANITDWNINVSSDATPIYGFCDNSSSRVPVNLRAGRIRVQGSFTYYAPAGLYVSTLADGASVAIDVVATTLTMPNVVFESAPITNNGANSPVFRTVNFRALGTADHGAIYTS